MVRNIPTDIDYRAEGEEEATEAANTEAAGEIAEVKTKSTPEDK